MPFLEHNLQLDEYIYIIDNIYMFMYKDVAGQVKFRLSIICDVVDYIKQSAYEKRNYY